MRRSGLRSASSAIRIPKLQALGVSASQMGGNDVKSQNDRGRDFGFFTIAPIPGSAATPSVTTIGTSYMANASNNCPTLTTGHFCTVTFAAVPTGKYLVVSNVSCLIATVAVATPFVFELVGSQPTFVANGVGVLFDGTAYYELTFSVDNVSTSGTQPLVNVTPLASSANLSVNCTIAGNLRTNP